MALFGLQLNGVVTDWSKVVITFGNVTQLPTLKSLDYGVKIDGVEEQRGAGQIAYGRSDGFIKCDEAKFTIAPADFLLLLAGIGGKQGMLNDSTNFDIGISYQIDQLGIQQYHDTLRSCRLISYAPKLETGKASMIECSLSVLDMSLCQPSLNILAGLGITVSLGLGVTL